MEEDFLLELRTTYAEIAQGFTETSFAGKAVYLKHYKDSDLLELDLLHKKYLAEAKEMELFTERERLDDVFKNGEWLKEEEEEYSRLNKKVSQWETSLSKILLESQKKKVEKDLEELKKEFSLLNEQREEVLGHTCESYTAKQKNLHIIKNAYFKDEDLTKPLFTSEEFDDLETNDYYSLVITQSICFTKFEEDKLQQVAAYPFFLNVFMASDNSVLNFYGKPLSELTLFQTSLFTRGRFYKSVLELGKSPPDFLYNNPKQLVSWYDNASKQNSSGHGGRAGNASNMAEISEGKASIKAGAVISEEGGNSIAETLAIEEATDAGSDTETLSLTSEADKLLKDSGKKTLNIMDMAKIHGLLD